MGKNTQEEVRNYFFKQGVAKTLTLEEEMKIFADELKRYFSKEEIPNILKDKEN